MSDNDNNKQLVIFCIFKVYLHPSIFLFLRFFNKFMYMFFRESYIDNADYATGEASKNENLSICNTYVYLNNTFLTSDFCGVFIIVINNSVLRNVLFV